MRLRRSLRLSAFTDDTDTLLAAPAYQIRLAKGQRMNGFINELGKALSAER